MKRIAVLGSGTGSNFQALLKAEDLGGEIVLVISDFSMAGLLALFRSTCTRRNYEWATDWSYEYVWIKV